MLSLLGRASNIGGSTLNTDSLQKVNATKLANACLSTHLPKTIYLKIDPLNPTT